MYIMRSFYNTWEEFMDAKFGNQIVEKCKNFIILKDGSMKYDFDKFNSYLDAIIDAVKNGEDINKVISLIFREKIDQPIVKEKLLKLINKV